MTFEGRGSGSWYCGFRFGAEERDVPIGEPFILHKFRLLHVGLHGTSAALGTQGLEVLVGYKRLKPAIVGVLIIEE